MSSKRYEHKLLESSNRAEFEQQLSSVGADGWSVIGYGILPDGSRSAVLQRKEHEERHDHHGHRRDHHHHDRHNRDAEAPRADSR